MVGTGGNAGAIGGGAAAAAAADDDDDDDDDDVVVAMVTPFVWASLRFLQNFFQ